jgi:hypothetical protein
VRAPTIFSTVVPDMKTANQIATALSDLTAKYVKKELKPNGINKGGRSE